MNNMENSSRGWTLGLIFLVGGGIFFLLHLIGFGDDYDMGAYMMFAFSGLMFVLTSITKRSKSDIEDWEQKQKQEQQDQIDRLKEHLDEKDRKDRKKKYGF